MQPANVSLKDLSGAVVLVGSMLSSDRTTGLPAGRTVSARLVERIVRPVLEAAPANMGITKADANLIERLALNTPFEVLLEYHPRPDQALRQLAALYRGGVPNPLHAALARAIKDGHVAHVVTTNYDTCIETAIRKELNPQLVIEEPHVNPLDWSSASKQPIVFKIHGCAETDHTMVFRLSQEGALPSWKRELLGQLVDGRDVVVMGYSGLDFDICPVLFGLGYRRIFWLFAEKHDFRSAIEQSSPNIQNVDRDPVRFDRVFGVLGGFDTVFDGLVDDKTYTFSPSNVPTDIAAQLFAGEATDPYGFQYWRGALLHTISCRLGAEAVCLSMNETDARRPESLRLWSDTLERAGRYRDSIRILGQLENVFTSSHRHDMALDALFIIAGRHYSGWRLFRFLRSWYAYRQRVAECIRSQVSFDERLAEARETYLLVLALKLPARIPLIGGFLSRLLGRNLLSGSLQKAAELHYLRGNWQDVRLLCAAADDLGIGVEVRDPHGSSKDADLLLSTIDAFSHANNIVGQASAYRRQRKKVSSRCEELLEALVAFGHTAEFWKAFISFASDLSDRRRRLYQGFAYSELKQCQYPWFTKVRFAIVFRMTLLLLDIRRVFR